MEEAKTIAVAGHRRVLEDGREMCSSESAAEYSERGEGDSDSDMYTADMMNEKGKPVLARAVITTGQAERLRNQGMAGGLATVSGVG
jgi:hypothetical protein